MWQSIHCSPSTRRGVWHGNNVRQADCDGNERWRACRSIYRLPASRAQMKVSSPSIANPQLKVVCCQPHLPSPRLNMALHGRETGAEASPGAGLTSMPTFAKVSSPENAPGLEEGWRCACEPQQRHKYPRRRRGTQSGSPLDAPPDIPRAAGLKHPVCWGVLRCPEVEPHSSVGRTWLMRWRAQGPLHILCQRCSLRCSAASSGMKVIAVWLSTSSPSAGLPRR